MIQRQMELIHRRVLSGGRNPEDEIITTLFRLTVEPFSMSWKDVIEMPASTFVEYIHEIKLYNEEMKKQMDKVKI